MKECSKFVCIYAGEYNFLIPSSQVVSSVYCSDISFFVGESFIFDNHELPIIDFYNDSKDLENSDEKHYIETALIIKNTEIFQQNPYFAMITSKECAVLDIEYKDFSLFSNKFEVQMKNKGFVACYFKDNTIYYLVDIEVLLKNFFM